MNKLLLAAATTVAANNYPESKLAVFIVLVITIGIVVWACWPSLRENNIFQKVKLYNYGKGEQAKAYVRHRQRDTLLFCIAANITGLSLLIYHAIQIKKQGAKYHATSLDGQPARFFLLSLFCTVCLFVFSLVGEVELDLIRNFRYSLKVWVTGIFTAPLLVIIINSYKFPNLAYLFYLYCKTVVMVSGIGSITFAILVSAVHYFTARPLKLHSKRLAILLTTQFAMLLNLLFATFIIHPDVNWLIGYLIGTAIMGLSIRYYDMDATVYSEVAYYEAEVVE